MKITCEHCKSKFKLDDEKVPKGQRFSIDCPKCKNKITIDLNESALPPESNDTGGFSATPISDAENTLMDKVSQEGYDAAEKPFDFVEEGVETALLCEPDPRLRLKIHQILNNMGYQIKEPESSMSALKQMRFHVFDMVVVNEFFDTEDPEDCTVLRYLEHLLIDIRRKIFVVMLTDRFRTMDNMTAFNKSVNLIVNLKNIDELEKILNRGVSDHTAFYRIFRESLVKTGRI
jgi:predicted Zn finger-like uncharacterized protein